MARRADKHARPAGAGGAAGPARFACVHIAHGVKLLEKNDFRNQRPALPEGRSAAPAAKAAAKAVVGGSSSPTISLRMVQMVGSENPAYLLQTRRVNL